jgi:hypothetical protein
MADKKLNSLDRFRKQSPRLVLEEHSHCEVPAGCGGVVLRWRNPLAVLPILVNYYAPGKATLFIDGREVTQIGNDVPPGSHVVGIELHEADLSTGLFMFAAVHGDRVHKTLPEGVSESPFRLVSEADRSWLVTTEEPDEYPHRWNELAFDDSKWQPLVRFVESPPSNSGEPNAYRIYRCNRHSAAFLALAPTMSSTGRVWVRRRFTVPGATVKREQEASSAP